MSLIYKCLLPLPVVMGSFHKTNILGPKGEASSNDSEIHIVYNSMHAVDVLLNLLQEILS